MNTRKYRPEKPETHKPFMWDDPQGDLVYESEEMSSLERTDDEMVFSIRASKNSNWKELADFISEECRGLGCWILEQRTRHQNFEKLETLPQELYEVEFNDDDNDDDNENSLTSNHSPLTSNHSPLTSEDEYDGEEPLFMLTRTDRWWEMYESDEDYLFRYRLPKCEKYPLSCHDDLDALEFLLYDEMPDITGFLRGMYEKVNGYANDNDDDNDKEEDA